MVALLSTLSVYGQSIDTVQFTHVSEYLYEAILPYSCYSAKFDSQERTYLYTANVELGIVSFDISDMQTPIPVDTILPAEFNGLKPTNLWHEGDLLYASLGGIQGLNAQEAGLAIMDVADPTDLSIVDQWSSPTYSEGAAVVIVDGDHAYLGGMEEGVLILDISTPTDIQFVSRGLMDENFPQIPGLFSHPNARGLSIRNDTLMVCNDAGGLRMMDVTDKLNPIEIGKYVNPDLFAIAQPAYNNVLLVDEYAYIPVDYCGLDVVDVSDTAMINVAWSNPWGCEGANWNGRPGHTNEIERVGEDLIFVSGADTEILAYDISDRENPILVGEYAFVGDSTVSWGVSANDQYVVLSLVNNSVFQQPYYSDVGGIMILEWQVILGIDEIRQQEFKVYPNPATDQISIETDESGHVTIIDGLGRLVYDAGGIPIGLHTIECGDWSRGTFFVTIETENERIFRKLILP
ncbi:MAG: T9SS type A sorting domain-containing protein [Flavobacteriales bacterium]|nr:T9SS type A sorting domain-containing protein [Flavobacteriales bacterium]